MRNVLDVGCATGPYVKAFRKLSIPAFGCDISKWAIENSDPDIRNYVQEGNVLFLPYGDQMYEIILCLDVLEHLEEKDLERAISEVARVSERMILFSITFDDSEDAKLDPTHKTLRSRGWWVCFINRVLFPTFKMAMIPYEIVLPDGVYKTPMVENLIVFMREGANEVKEKNYSFR